MALIKVSAADVRLNSPLPFAIYTNSGKLLLSQGQSIRSERQLERLFSEGAFRRDDGYGPSRPSRAGRRRPHEPHVPVAGTNAANSAPVAQPAEFPKLPSAVESFQLVLDDDQPALNVTLVGTVDGQGLIVSAPDSDALQPGVEADGRMLFGRDICTFRTRVSARSAEIPGIVMLEPPQNVRRTPVRRHRRVRVAVPAHLIRNDSQSFQANVVDLSVEGVGLRMDACHVEPGEHFRLGLRLTVHDKSHAMLLNCIARNVRLQKSGDFLIGAEIRTTTADARALLRGFVFEVATGTAL
jgi:hypothetical protein